MLFKSTIIRRNFTETPKNNINEFDPNLKIGDKFRINFNIIKTLKSESVFKTYSHPSLEMTGIIPFGNDNLIVDGARLKNFSFDDILGGKITNMPTGMIYYNKRNLSSSLWKILGEINPIVNERYGRFISFFALPVNSPRFILEKKVLDQFHITYQLESMTQKNSMWNNKLNLNFDVYDSLTNANRIQPITYKTKLTWKKILMMIYKIIG